MVHNVNAISLRRYASHAATLPEGKKELHLNFEEQAIREGAGRRLISFDPTHGPTLLRY